MPMAPSSLTAASFIAAPSGGPVWMPDQPGGGVHRAFTGTHLPPFLRLAAAACADWSAGCGFPAHRGSPLPLLRLLARAGAHPENPVLRTHPARTGRAGRQWLEPNPVPG